MVVLLEHDPFLYLFFSFLGLRHGCDEEAEVESRREVLLRGEDLWAWDYRGTYITLGTYGWVWLGMAWYGLA